MGSQKCSQDTGTEPPPGAGSPGGHSEPLSLPGSVLTPPLQHSSPELGPCCIAPKVLARLQLKSRRHVSAAPCIMQAFKRPALHVFLLGITEVLNNGEGELHLCFCRDLNVAAAGWAVLVAREVSLQKCCKIRFCTIPPLAAQV